MEVMPSAVGVGSVAPASGFSPFLNIIPAVEVERREREESERKEAELTGPAASNLLSYLNRLRDEAIQAKDNSGVTDRLLEAQRRRKGEHSAEKKAQLKAYGMPDYWVPRTQTKCLHGEAWLRDLMGPNNIFQAEPTVLPELQDDDTQRIFEAVMDEALAAMAGGENVTDQQIQDLEAKVAAEYKTKLDEDAKDKASAMEKLILDQLEECGFKDVLREYQSNLVTYGTAFIKGPFTVQKKSPKWVGTKRVVEDKVIPSCSAPSPFDIYPAPWAKTERDGVLFERIKTYRDALSTVRMLPHYQTAEIEALLTETRGTPAAISQRGDTERSAGENKGQSPTDDRFEVWQATGPLPGYMLEDWGITGCNPVDDYRVEVLWCGNHILKVVPRWDEVGVNGYFRSTFKELPGSFWGLGIPHLMSASQDRANLFQMCIIDNSLWATGPVGSADISVIHPDDIKSFHAHKLIPYMGRPGYTGNPLTFADIPLHVAELDRLYQQALTDSDDESGVPAYAYGIGSASPGAGTYGGYTTALQAAAKGMKDTLLSEDDMISRFVSHWADWNLTYSDDESVKGDIRIVCTGATGFYVKEVQMDRTNHLITQATPFIPITGPRFAMGLLRQQAKDLKADARGLPTDEELVAREKAPKEPTPVPIKPNLSVTVKWELLTPEEKVAFLRQVGVNEAPPPVEQLSSEVTMAAPAKSLPAPGAAATIPEPVPA